MDKCRQLQDTATLMTGKQILVVILLTKTGSTLSIETSLTNQMTPCYNQEGTDLIPNHLYVHFMLCNLLSHQTHIIHMVNRHSDIFMPAPMEIPTKSKAVHGFRAFEFCTTHSFINCKFSTPIHLFYTEFGLLHTAHRLTLCAIAPWLCKTECQTVLCVYYMPIKVCDITIIQSKK
jgi:hypothetical protein